MDIDDCNVGRPAHKNRFEYRPLFAKRNVVGVVKNVVVVNISVGGE